MYDEKFRVSYYLRPDIVATYQMMTEHRLLHQPEATSDFHQRTNQSSFRLIKFMKVINQIDIPFHPDSSHTEAKSCEPL